MFTQSCFIRKNSMYIAKYLKKLGYHTYNIDDYKNAPHNWCIVTDAEINYAGIWSNEPKGEAANRRIDCGTNGRLFLAIAALRDDSDKYQWFTNKSNTSWWLCTDFDSFIKEYKFSNEDKELKIDYWHKATVQELIEYFKDK